MSSGGTTQPMRPIEHRDEIDTPEAHLLAVLDFVKADNLPGDIGDELEFFVMSALQNCGADVGDYFKNHRPCCEIGERRMDDVGIGWRTTLRKGDPNRISDRRQVEIEHLEAKIRKRRVGERRKGERRHLPGPRGWERLPVCRRRANRRQCDE